MSRVAVFFLRFFFLHVLPFLCVFTLFRMICSRPPPGFCGVLMAYTGGGGGRDVYVFSLFAPLAFVVFLWQSLLPSTCYKVVCCKICTVITVGQAQHGVITKELFG